MYSIFPGTFDPITLGHLDIIRRSARLCDKLYIGVASAHHKNTLFTLDERVMMVERAIQHIDGVIEVVQYDGLLVTLCEQLGVRQIIRGVRWISDFEHELQLAGMNRHLNADIETTFLPSGAEKSFISSTLAREVAKLSGNLNELIPEEIKQIVIKKQLKNN